MIIICSKCAKAHLIAVDRINISLVGSDERTGGTEYAYSGGTACTCIDCRNMMTVFFDVWEFPKGEINYKEVSTERCRIKEDPNYIDIIKTVNDVKTSMISEEDRTFEYYGASARLVENVIRNEHSSSEIDDKINILISDMDPVKRRKLLIHISTLFLNVLMNRLEDLGGVAEENSIEARRLISLKVSNYEKTTDLH